ncbi:hypothetical protein CKO31_19255 [Thiohalocapsa halophila]|jgi:transcriptional regulator with XRE-family HTH domain|uniref:HTH cro/C1-type domain-containing protein n=1 Tax=Thiohalocapsa halophila TaxID=69359 RepID=A0ABS1CNB6_9GAMM|nr:helix-turn-helix transcriptional regulator [Thiohalocapsa halophila]MBK1632846.1 hypothetical protein [Thiohalocapsa halophila]NBC13689.1 helix-turn-helix domain-containing protein [Gammaproteobacteria bacterium]
MTESELELTREIGRRLRAARHARGLSLAGLAALTDGLYGKSRISNYEQGLRRPSVEGAQALAEALGNVSAAYLLCLEGGEATAMSAEEMRLLDAFRRADADWQQRVLDCAHAVQLEPPPRQGRRSRNTGRSARAT